MPAEQRFGLEEVGGVFPGLNAAGQQDEPETIRLSEVGPFDLAIVSGIPQGSNRRWRGFGARTRLHFFERDERRVEVVFQQVYFSQQAEVLRVGQPADHLCAHRIPAPRANSRRRLIPAISLTVTISLARVFTPLCPARV